MKESINGSIALLGKTIKEVISISKKVNAGTAELAQSAVVLTDNTNSQAASIEHISQTMNNISSRARTNEQNAAKVQDISSQALEAVEKKFAVNF